MPAQPPACFGRLDDTAERFGTGDGSCGAAIEPGVAGRTAFTLRIQTGCANRARTASSRQHVGRRAACRSPTCLPSSTGCSLRVQGGCAHRGSSRVLRPRSHAAIVAGRIARYPRGLVRVGGSALLFRISSLEPKDCTPDVVGLIAGHDSFAPHLHLPLQHASDRMLAAMRRPYTLGDYSALVDSIRARIPHASIGSDIIVGFPGGTRPRFRGAGAYLECSPITHVHVFPYSERPGTAAAEMAGKVPGVLVRERGRRIRDISARLSTLPRSQVGSVHRALTIEDGSLAVTGNYLKVRIASGQPRNEWIQVAITGAADDHRHRPRCDGRRLAARARARRTIRKPVEPLRDLRFILRRRSAISALNVVAGLCVVVSVGLAAARTSRRSDLAPKAAQRAVARAPDPRRSAGRRPHGCRGRGSSAPTPARRARPGSRRTGRSPHRTVARRGYRRRRSTESRSPSTSRRPAAWPAPGIFGRIVDAGQQHVLEGDPAACSAGTACRPR